MAKSTRGRRGIASRQCRATPYPLPSYDETDGMLKSRSKLYKQDWEDATCSVCMECPHNAVLLLCSSHEKGCRPYMCATSSRYSNCLDQYKKAYTKETISNSHPCHDSLDSQELACPLCRGQVKGWTIVEPAREHLNAKKRNCMQDNCSFIGTYKELRKHVKVTHPSAKPREVDPCVEQKWRRMERERERDDVMSTIRSSMPGAVFFGDYVIEGGSHSDVDSEDEEGFDSDAMVQNEGIDQNLMSVFLFLQAFDNAVPQRGLRRHERGSNILNGGAVRSSRESDETDDDNDDDNDNNDGGGGNYSTSMTDHLRRQGRVVLGHSRRTRRGEANGRGENL